MGEFDGKVAFITGAAHGQGRATALALAREGAEFAGFDVAHPLSYPGYEMGSLGRAGHRLSRPVAGARLRLCDLRR